MNSPTRLLFSVPLAIIMAASVCAQETNPKPTRLADSEDEAITELSPFVVSGETGTGYSSQQTLAGSRSSKSLVELPTNISIINKEQIEDLGAVDVHGVLKFGVSGVTQNQTIGDDVNIRGFRTNGSLRNGMPMSSGTKPNPLYDVDRIEVVKGPAAMVLGGSSNAIGGVVNMISNAPSAVRTSSLQTTFSDNNYFRVAANTAGPAYKSNDFTALYRVTVGGLRADRDKEIEDQKEKFLGGAVSLYFGSNTSVLISGYIFENTGYQYWNDFLDVSGPNWTPSVLALGTAKLNQYSTKSFSPFRRKNAYLNNTNSVVDVTFLTKLTTNSNLRLFYFQSALKDDDNYERGITVQQDNFTLNRQDIPERDDSHRWFMQLDYLHHYAFKPVTFDTMVGVDAIRTETRTAVSVNDATNGGPAPLDTRNPDYSADDAYFAKLMPGRGLPHLQRYGTDALNASFYAQENIAFWKERIILVGGLRWFRPSGTDFNFITNVDTRRTEIHTRVHKYGAVVRVLPWVSAYYTDAENVNIQTGPTDKFKANDQLGPPLQNQLGQNKEFGLKVNYELSKNITLYGTLAHFDMALTNVRTFGDLGNGVEGIIQSAQDAAEGWEVDYGMRFKMSSGNIDIVATYFDGDSSIAQTKGVQAAGFVGTKYSLMARHSWVQGRLKGAMIGGGYEDESDKRNGNFLVPGHTVVSLFGRYTFGKNWSVQLNLDNVGDKRYIVAQAATGLVQVADPFRTRLTVKYTW